MLYATARISTLLHIMLVKLATKKENAVLSIVNTYLCGQAKGMLNC